APDARSGARAYRGRGAAVRAALHHPVGAPPAPPLLAAPIAEADAALTAAGLAGNERTFLDLVSAQALGGAGRERRG
ncbi:hypothetical protein, partial [Streptomyces sp. NPDC059142]|uniref:hypothetical protein n=1 Tax=Streptomyces sp. NPDC059142 TaxID=3346739 RepID=UPI0036A2727F